MALKQRLSDIKQELHQLNHKVDCKMFCEANTYKLTKTKLTPFHTGVTESAQ